MDISQITIADGSRYSGGRGRWVYPGPTTELKLANGTTFTLQNFARVLVPFDGISTGEQIYQNYFIPPPGEPKEVEVLATQSTSTYSAEPTSMSTTIPAPGYPTPVLREMNNLNVSTDRLYIAETVLMIYSPDISSKAKATTT